MRATSTSSRRLCFMIVITNLQGECVALLDTVHDRSLHLQNISSATRLFTLESSSHRYRADLRDIMTACCEFVFESLCSNVSYDHTPAACLYEHECAILKYAPHILTNTQSVCPRHVMLRVQDFNNTH